MLMEMGGGCDLVHLRGWAVENYQQPGCSAEDSAFSADVNTVVEDGVALAASA